MSKTQETLQEMARLTMLTNRLNEVQLTNLKMFPLVFFNNVKEANMDYDLSNNLDVDTEEDSKKVDISYKVKANANNLRVSYRLDTTEADQDNLDKRFEAIAKSVHGLLWKEVNVQVYFGDKLAFESKK